MKVEKDDYGNVKITFDDDTQIEINKASRGERILIRTVSHKFVIHPTGAVNVIELEMKRLGEP
jgi:hypothetical protein